MHAVTSWVITYHDHHDLAILCKTCLLVKCDVSLNQTGQEGHGVQPPLLHYRLAMPASHPSIHLAFY